MNKATESIWNKKVRRHLSDSSLRHWLLDDGSLTARLKARGTFSVLVLSQGLARPFHDEIGALGLKAHQLAGIREVVLHCSGQPLVFAHSVLPRKPRGPLKRWLNRLGNRSLGALLFAHPSFSRAPLSYLKLDSRHPLFHRSLSAMQLRENIPEYLWARRSRFDFKKQSILVTEVFSPKLTQ